MSFLLPTAPRAQQESELLATMSRLRISLPYSIAMSGSVRRHLEDLARERCDKQAIVALGDTLQQSGRRREAATALSAFSEECGGSASALRQAVNILLSLNDHSLAVDYSNKLIELEAYHDNGYYLRAQAYRGLGDCKKAIDDYATAIELFGNKDRISSVGYLNMARCYEKLGQFCDAIVPVQTWVALNPSQNDTSQTRAIIDDYSRKGQCSATDGGREETVAIARVGQTITVRALINGVPGRFVVDTGATFVSLKRSFADRAGVETDRDSLLKLHTANGIVSAHRGRAKAVALGKLVARDVAIAIQTDERATYGNNVDGLLGMSFLSRFDLTLSAKALKLKTRQRI